MVERRITINALPAKLDANRSLVVPAGETIDVSVSLGNNQVRIFWSGNKEGLGGLTVTESDLEANTKRA